MVEAQRWKMSRGRKIEGSRCKEGRAKKEDDRKRIREQLRKIKMKEKSIRSEEVSRWKGGE